jgi:ABC-type polysaccharide/polyol phosphate export permease
MKSENETKQQSRPSIAGAVSAVLSVTFLVLAAYIAWSSTVVTGSDSRELRYFAILVGAYGIWRMIRTVIRTRSDNS